MCCCSSRDVAEIEIVSKLEILHVAASRVVRKRCRSPAAYDVIVKNNSKDEEQLLKVLEQLSESIQIILNTESTLCLLYRGVRTRRA